MNLGSIGQFSIFGLLLLVVFIMGQQTVKSITDWSVKQGLNWFQNSTIPQLLSSDDVEGNKEAVDLGEEIYEELQEREEEISEYERMIRSLRDENISKRNIITDYWNPLPAIIITFFNDYEDGKDDLEDVIPELPPVDESEDVFVGSDGETIKVESEEELSAELERGPSAEGEEKPEGTTNEIKIIKDYITKNNDAKSLTGFTYVIPPSGFPNRFSSPSEVTRNDIETWIQEDILSDYNNPKAVICQASPIDLRRIYYHTDYEEHSIGRETIGQALDIENILDGHDVHRILASESVNLSKAIENGHIGFFVSRFVSSDELSIIHEKEDWLQDKLGDPSLRAIADDSFKAELADALSNFLDEPNVVAEKAVEEAKLWEERMRDAR